MISDEIINFVNTRIIPYAHMHDQDEKISSELILSIGKKGYLGAIVPEKYSGMGMDLTTFGMLNFEIGKGCTSVRSLITVQSMAASAIERWGTEDQKNKWLPKIAAGSTIAGFALTEPDFGSDAAGIQTIVSDGDNSDFILNGQKKWISFGQIADLFLVFGRHKDQLCCVMVEKDTPGLGIKAIQGIFGARGIMLAQLEFKNCKVPGSNLIGCMGFGLHPVAFTALDMGRYSIAWGCVGMAQACLEASIRYSKSRKQFGKNLSEHQLIQAMISDMMVDIKAAQQLCEHAGRLKESNDRDATRQMLMAKYFAANMAVRVTSKAVELHGANGYSPDYVVQRFFRDAKIMETIEGSNQIMQIMIAKYGVQDYSADL